MAETTAGAVDRRLTTILAAQTELLLADRGDSLLRNSGALVYQGDFANEPALTKKCPLLGWMGYNRLAEVLEDGTIPDTTITDGSVNVSVALQAKSYSGNAHVALHSPSAIYNDPSAATMDAVVSRDGRLVEQIAALGDDWTATTAGAGTAMTVDKFFEAIGLLEAANVPARPGEVIWQATPSHYRELAEDLRTEQGTMEYQAATQAMQEIKGSAFRGTLGGVDLTVSTLLPVSGADTYSQMFARGGVYFADATPRVGPAAIGVLIDKVFVEWQRNAKTTANADECIVHAWTGVSQAQDGAGVKIPSTT